MITKHTIHSLLIAIIVLFAVSCTSTLYVAPKQVDCTGAAAQKCYLIRKSSEGNWIMHYQEIQGFDYELGFSYKIKVKKEKMKHVPMDGASYQYNVVEVLEKNDVTESITLADLLDKEWKLEYLKWDGAQYGIEGKAPTLTFKNDGKVSGFAGCNNYFGTFKIHGRTIDIGEFGATRMMCEGKMELEEIFLKALGSEVRAIFSEGKLVLSSDGGNTMIFTYK